MRRLPASPAFARQQRARQDQPVVLGEALAGAGFDDREPLSEVIEGSVGPLLRPQAAEAKVKTRKMGFGAAAGAQMEAGQERREPGLALDWLFGLPGVGQQKRAEERRQTVGLCHPGVPAGEFLCLVPGLVIDERALGAAAGAGVLPGWRRGASAGSVAGGASVFSVAANAGARVWPVRGRTLGAGTLPCPLPCPLPSPSDFLLGTRLGDTVGAVETAAAPDQPQNPSGRQQGFGSFYAKVRNAT